MVLSEISDLRTIHQQIAGTAFSTAKELVAWMGAIQAQDYTMAKWAIGSRLGNSKDVEDDGQLYIYRIILQQLNHFF